MALNKKKDTKNAVQILKFHKKTRLKKTIEFKSTSESEPEALFEERIEEERAIQIPSKDLEKFCKINNFEIKIIDCKGCDKKLKTTIPYYLEGFACLEAPTCKCGVKSRRMIMKPASPDKKEFFAKLIKTFT